MSDGEGGTVHIEGGTAKLRNTTVIPPDGAVLIDGQTVEDDTFDPGPGSKAGDATV